MSHNGYIRSEFFRFPMTSRISTGSSRLSLAACADKLIADKFESKSQEFNKMASSFLTTSYVYKLQEKHPQLVGQDFGVLADGTIVLG